MNKLHRRTRASDDGHGGAGLGEGRLALPESLAQPLLGLPRRGLELPQPRPRLLGPPPALARLLQQRVLRVGGRMEGAGGAGHNDAEHAVDVGGRGGGRVAVGREAHAAPQPLLLAGAPPPGGRRGDESARRIGGGSGTVVGRVGGPAARPRAFGGGGGRGGGGDNELQAARPDKLEREAVAGDTWRGSLHDILALLDEDARSEGVGGVDDVDGVVVVVADRHFWQLAGAGGQPEVAEEAGGGLVAPELLGRDHLPPPHRARGRGVREEGVGEVGVGAQGRPPLGRQHGGVRGDGGCDGGARRSWGGGRGAGQAGADVLVGLRSRPVLLVLI
mmetsp:Transcript_33275/g.85297  ORF Transcript_33275/g.85297 Transcript_33275/m.85297 type:complete len:332 (+) Transcript_33275:87-1082(+)